MENIVVEREGKNPTFLLKAPLCVSIITTNRCNLRCKHCINSAMAEQNIDSLSTVDIKRIIEECKNSGVETLEFNGGEFFVREDNQELLDFAVQSGMSISITTNGTLINEDWIKKYKGKISLLRISVDSHIEEEHDKFRGVKGSFKKTINNIRSLKANGYHVTVLTTVTKSRLHNFEEFLDFLSEVGVDGLHTTMLIPAGRGKSLDKDVVSPQEHKEFLERYRDYKKKYKTRMTILEESPQTCLLADYEHEEYPCKCGAAFTEVVILDDGYVLPCASFISSRDKFRQAELNIKERSLIEIYRNSELMNMVRDVNGLHGKCSECSYINECGGGCRAAALIRYDDIYAPDPLCWLQE